jgi:hypothetical protein
VIDVDNRASELWVPAVAFRSLIASADVSVHSSGDRMLEIAGDANPFVDLLPNLLVASASWRALADFQPD